MEEKARIWFFTDIHGSNACFRKFLNLVKNENKPNVLVIGADITGKQIIPIVEYPNNIYVLPIGGDEVKVRSSELDEMKSKLNDIGFYTYECSQHGYKNFIYDEEKQREVFERLVKERLAEWIKLADEKLPSPEECKVIINAGNDDPYFVDQILDTSSKMIRAEGKIIEIPGGLKVLSTGYSTPTPWKCPRDVTEEELKKKIAAMTSQVSGADKLIFNFHCPPKYTSLDLANKIDEQTKKRITGLGKHPTTNAGSQSIREAIEFWNPIASLHGHIHEVHSKEYINKTFCCNPGSDYQNGRLQGVFLQINKEGEIEYERLTEERLTDKFTDESATLWGTILSSLPIVGSIYTNYITGKHQKNIEDKVKHVQADVEEIKNLLKKGNKKNEN